jgi:ABC-type amino acid transport substrate-binding protein
MKEKDVRVGISQFPPFIMKKNGGYEGFEIELWNKVARELNFKSHFHEYEFQELIPLIQEGKIDVAVSGMAITREREKLIDLLVNGC